MLQTTRSNCKHNVTYGCVLQFSIFTWTQMRIDVAHIDVFDSIQVTCLIINI